MPRRTGILLLALAFALPTGRLDAFLLKGWEHDSVLTNAGRPVISDDGYALQAAVLDGTVLAFTRSGNFLRVVPVSGPAEGPARDVVPADPLSVPVVKEHNGAVYILSCRDGEYRFYRMRSARSAPEQLFGFSYPLNFHADFFPLDAAGDRILVSLPAVLQGQYTVRLELFEKRGLGYARKTIGFPPPGEQDKGSFFFRLFPEKGKYTAYFIRRYYESDKKFIGDSIFTFTVKSPEDIPKAVPKLLIPYGYSDHPPEVIMHRGTPYILYSRKRGSVYSFRLLDLRRRLEYTISRESLNAYAPRFFYRDGKLDLFYLGRSGDRSRIYSRRVDLDRLEAASYLARLAGDQDASSGDPENATAIAVANRGTERFLVYLSGPGGAIRWTRDDRTAPAVVLDASLRTEGEWTYPVWTWKMPEDPSGLSGFSYAMDRSPGTEPVVPNLGPGDRTLSGRHRESGKYYLHIRAMDGVGNAGPVLHVPFEVRASGAPGVPATERDRLAVIEETLRNLRLELEISNRYERAAYGALLEYYGDAEKMMRDRQYALARSSVTKAALIEPARMETVLYRQFVRKKERSVFYRYDFLFVLAAGIVLIAALSLTARGLELL